MRIEFDNELFPAQTGLLAEWDLWMSAAGRSDRTRTERLRTARRFCRQANPLTCDWKAIAAFLDAHPDRSTKVTYYGQLRALFKWLVLTDRRLDDPCVKMPTIRAPRREPRPLSIEELGAVLNSRLRRRTRAMVVLAAYQGLRVSEIARVAGPDLRGRRLRVRGKGDTDLTMPVHDLVLEVAEGMPDIGWWFPSSKHGQHVRGCTVSTTLRKAMMRAGVDATPHQLRHTFGTGALRTAGGNVRVAQRALRHASITSTQIYTLVDDDEVAQAITDLPVPPHLWRGAGPA